jgi:ABC-type glycerol-3-phosphate transport system substrate-binding protein
MAGTHPRSRRQIVRDLAILVAPTVATACTTGNPDAPAPTPGGAGAVPKSLNGFEFWQPWPIDQPTHGGPIGWKQLSEAFNATTTNKVQVTTPAGDYIAAVQASISAGTPPDGWQADQQWMVVYASKGASAPLDDLIKRDKWDKASIFPSAYETMTWNGRVWGMMQHPDIVFMWYATGLLKENGVDPAKLPMTWQDLDVAAQKATRKQGDGFDSSGSLRILALTGRSSLPNQTGRNWSPMMARLCSSTHQKWSRPSSGSRAT